MLQKFIYTIAISTLALRNNKLRAILASLGVMFGVASVIAMLAIGSGAQKEILEQMKSLGTNNIIVKSIFLKEENTNKENQHQGKRFSPGVTIADVINIETIPHVHYVTSEIFSDATALHNERSEKVKVVGVSESYFAISKIELFQGDFFSSLHYKNTIPVCLIGYGIKVKFFIGENPIGKMIKCGNVWFRIIGILKERKSSNKNIQQLGRGDYNMDIYLPIQTFLLRYENRTLVTQKNIAKREEEKALSKWYPKNTQPQNYHQLDFLTVQVDDVRYIGTVAEIINRMLQRKHNDVKDFEIIIPKLLLEQEQKAKDIFNAVLGTIASISLLVGGIGIMNIMLASVLERIKEIGIRRSVGATKKDIVLQFLNEAVAISITGGIFGLGVGILISYIIEKSTGILTVISPFSIIISLVVSLSIGLLFGIFPAKKAAEQNPIDALRYE